MGIDETMDALLSDEKIRGLLLKHFYNLRHANGGWCPISEAIVAPYPVELRILGSVCQHLADIRLIEWRSLEGEDGVVDGMAKITGKGAAAVESGVSSEISIHFPSGGGATSNTLPNVGPRAEVGSVAKSSKQRNQIFVVHGHDEGARESVARFVERLGFEAIILHEQANQGRTIIEKIEAHGDVGFAIVLLTPDDEGCKKGETPEPRARQNVLLELGYFIGKLGRARVCAFRRGTVNIPSDFSGVIWTVMDEANGWMQELARELQAAGYAIDWNKVMA